MPGVSDKLTIREGHPILAYNSRHNSRAIGIQGCHRKQRPVHRASGGVLPGDIQVIAGTIVPHGDLTHRNGPVILAAGTGRWVVNAVWDLLGGHLFPPGLNVIYNILVVGIVGLKQH